MAWDESKSWLQGNQQGKYYQGLLDDAEQMPARNSKRHKVVHPENMPWEMARQGLLKHLLNESMNTRIEMVEVAARDGLQNESSIVTLEGKRRLIEADETWQIVDRLGGLLQGEPPRLAEAPALLSDLLAEHPDLHEQVVAAPDPRIVISAADIFDEDHTAEAD